MCLASHLEFNSVEGCAGFSDCSVPYDVSKYIRYAETQLVDNLLQSEGVLYWSDVRTGFGSFVLAPVSELLACVCDLAMLSFA